MPARNPSFVTTLLALAFAALASVAGAQIAPDDSGSGTQLGMAAEHNSGQTGFVTLFARRGAETLVLIRLDAEPPGRAEPAHVHRGADCDTLDPVPAYPLAPVINGVSKTLVKAPEDKLLSGNYDVNVHSSIDPKIYFACGHLYR